MGGNMKNHSARKQIQTWVCGILALAMTSARASAEGDFTPTDDALSIDRNLVEGTKVGCDDVCGKIMDLSS